MGRLFKNYIFALRSYGFLIKFFLILILAGFSFRFFLSFLYLEKFDRSFIPMVLYGVRMDIIIISTFAVLISVCYSLNLIRLSRYLIVIFCMLYLSVEIATFPFMEKFGSRPNYLFIEHLASYRELLSMLVKMYWVKLLISLPFIIFISYKISFYFKPRLKKHPVVFKIAALPLILLILFTGIRSSFDSSTPNQGYYTFSTSNLKNEIANNSIFSILYATYLMEHETFYNYGDMTSEKAIENINGILDKKAGNKIKLQSNKGPKKNVILIILESFGNEHVGYLGGTDTTPNLDSLRKESLYFTRMYATGSRTSWGLSSIMTSLYPIPSREYIKAARSQKDFYTIARSFRKNGYTNYFLYGGDANFDNMRGFFLSNGFDRVMGKEVFGINKKRYSWGYCDEDLYEKAFHTIKESEKPLFLTLLTLSSHEPFDYPKGKVSLYKGAKPASFENSIKYSDYVLGKFIEKLRDNGILKNSVVALIADHCSSVRGNFDVPVDKYRIPALIIDESFRKRGGIKYDKIASQIDFGPTILDVAGVNEEQVRMGKSVLRVQKDSALLLSRRKNFAYLLKDRFIVFKDGRDTKSYLYNYISVENKEKDISDGLSFIYGSKSIYENNGTFTEKSAM